MKFIYPDGTAYTVDTLPISWNNQVNKKECVIKHVTKASLGNFQADSSCSNSTVPQFSTQIQNSQILSNQHYIWQNVIYFVSGLILEDLIFNKSIKL